MSELILKDTFLDDQVVRDDEGDEDERQYAKYRVTLTATRLMIHPWNDAADQLLDDTITLNPDELRELLKTG